MSDGFLLVRSDDLRLSFETSNNPVYRIEKILLIDGLLIMTRSSQCRFITYICDISTGEARSMLRQEFKIKIFCELETSEMNREYLFPLLQVRKIDMNLSVKTTGTHESLVKDVCTVGCSEDDDTGI